MTLASLAFTAGKGRHIVNSPDRIASIVIVGAGLAGLFLALKLSPRPVTVISAQLLGDGASSTWPQVGIAAAVGADDTADAHATDIIDAGAGLVDEAIAHLVAREAADRLDDLRDYGVPFDRDENGNLALSREPAHRAKRIIRFADDGSGKAVMSALIEAVRATPSITLLEEYEAQELITEGDGPQQRVTGLYLSRPHDIAARYKVTDVGAVVLATGGIGALFRITTNPAHARGDGVAIGARAGAIVADAEFVQFHPTAIDVDRDPVPLATEALRADGATLVDGVGRSFMTDVHADAERAPRDVVARAVHRQIASGNGAFLDATKAIGSQFKNRFPTVYRGCMEAGIDPSIEPIPIAPAAHFHMGGLRTDAQARTNVDGLWAVGEVAATGANGANQLASNALLEAVVMAARAATDIAQTVPVETCPATSKITRERSLHLPDFGARTAALAMLRETMSRNVGMERDDESLRQALQTLKDIAAAGAGDPVIENATITARFVAEAALRRRETRGGHTRIDHPTSDPALARSRTMTLAGLSLRDSLASGEHFLATTAGGGKLH